jgi:hypothetical protein
MALGMGLALSAPRREEAGKAGQMGAEEALLLGEALAGRCRGRAQGVGGDVLM